MTQTSTMEPPPFLDRRPNGRCRAYWRAHQRCPGNRNPHSYAMDHYQAFVEDLAKLDETEGKIAPCRSLGPERDPGVRKRERPAVRVRTRVRPD